MWQPIKNLTLSLVLAVGLGVAVSAHAQQDQGFVNQSDWTMSIGAGMSFQPAYEGGQHFDYRFMPLVDANWRNTAFLKVEGLDQAVLGVNAYQSDNITLGGGIQSRPGRSNDQSDPLRGQNEVERAVELFLFGEVIYNYFKFDAKIAQGTEVLTNGHTGMLAEAGVSVGAQLSPQFDAFARLGTFWGSDSYMNAYFGTVKNKKTNIDAYTAHGGFKDIRLDVTANYHMTSSVSVQGRAGYKMLIGNAARSPLVSGSYGSGVGNPSQFYIGMGVVYKF